MSNRPRSLIVDEPNEVQDVFEPVLATSLTDEIAARIESSIFGGAYPPGSRLRQDELCERFGVSRTPVREALRQLQARNLVVVIPNKGATVRIPSRKEVMDVYGVRSELEGYACELAAKRSKGEVVAELDEAQRRLVPLVKALKSSASKPASTAAIHIQLSKANDEFHRAIHRGADNERLTRLIQEIGRLFPQNYIWRAAGTGAELQAVNIDEHRMIRDGLAAGNAVVARRAMRDHILHARNILVRYLDELGFWK